MNLCQISSHVLYQLHAGTYKNMANFQSEATRQLLQVHHMPKLSLTGGKPLKGNDWTTHFPSPNTPTGKPGLQSCFMWTHRTLRSRKRIESHYTNDRCDKELCVTPCFRIYHTKLVFWKRNLPFHGYFVTTESFMYWFTQEWMLMPLISVGLWW